MGNQRALRKTVMAGGRALGPATAAQIRATEARPAGGMVDAVPPSQEAIRAAIAEGKCPFCGSGPWKMLPVHTNKIHGVDKWELRDLAGFSTNDALCSEDSRARMSVAALRNPENQRRATEAGRQGRAQYRQTRAGRERQAMNLARWVAEDPERAREQCRRASAAITPEGHARRIEAVRAAAASRPRTPEQLAAFARRMGSPEARARRQAERAARLQPCGTVASYKRGCRCEPCREAKSQARKLAYSTRRANPAE